MIDVSPLRMLLLTVTTWLDRQEREILAYLIEKNRVLFVAHYQCERNHQGLGDELIELPPAHEHVGRIRRRSNLGGVLNYYARAP